MRLFKLLFLMCAVVFALHAKADDNIIAIHGSNTINSLLTPKLVESWCLSIPRATCQTRQGEEGSIVIDVSVAQEKRERFVIFAKGTETGQTALFAGQADIAAASDRYTAEQELQLVNGGGKIYVVGLDAVAIIVNRSNPLFGKSITQEEVSQIFSGEIAEWSRYGKNAPVKLLIRDTKSGTHDLFKRKIMEPYGRDFGKTATPFESSQLLKTAVEQNVDAIGFVGLAHIGSAHALKIRAECGPSHRPPFIMQRPDDFLVQKEIYPISRRLLFYTAQATPKAQSFLNYMSEKYAQNVARNSGFVDQAAYLESYCQHKFWLEEVKGGSKVGLEPNAAKNFDDLIKLAQPTKRLSFNLLFETNSDKLEPKARQDLRRIGEYLNNGAVDTTRMHIVGFADSRGAWLHNYNLALARATQVANALSSLIDGAINKSNIHSFSWHAPCACNDGEAGWEKNRRVEIWFDLDEKEKQVPCSETAY